MVIFESHDSEIFYKMLKRLYFELLKEHFHGSRQMIFLAGPRQVGKTTISLQWGEKRKNFFYLNWDNTLTQKKILAGPKQIAEETGLLKLQKQKPLLIFDEIHKYGRWKQFLKGFFDDYGHLCEIIVTGSSKLNIYKRIGDSLMGRYFLYRIHPLSVGELCLAKGEQDLISLPKKLSKQRFIQLLTFGGFPEPFLHEDPRFSRKWQRSRKEQLFFEDIRNLSHIQELAQLEMLALLMTEYSGKQFSFSSLAAQIQVSIPTISRWLETLESFYYCFSVRPWTKNVKRSLRKEPKFFLWDWSLVKDALGRGENFVASHLLKAVHFWNDCGLGEFSLHYLRDKEKREVDFLVAKDGKPWFLVEVKSGDNFGISKSLYHFQEQTGAPHAFQVNIDSDYVDQDCFAYNKPIIVPASTFLSQLI